MSALILGVIWRRVVLSPRLFYPRRASIVDLLTRRLGIDLVGVSKNMPNLI